MQSALTIMIGLPPVKPALFFSIAVSSALISLVNCLILAFFSTVSSSSSDSSSSSSSPSSSIPDNPSSDPERSSEPASICSMSAAASSLGRGSATCSSSRARKRIRRRRTRQTRPLLLPLLLLLRLPLRLLPRPPRPDRPDSPLLPPPSHPSPEATHCRDLRTSPNHRSLSLPPVPRSAMARSGRSRCSSYPGRPDLGACRSCLRCLISMGSGNCVHETAHTTSNNIDKGGRIMFINIDEG